MKDIKWTVFYKMDGQRWQIQVDPLYECTNIEDYNKLPEYTYYKETNSGLIKCDSEGNII